MKAWIIAVVISALALANPCAWADSHARKVIITFKSGTPRAICDKTLAKLGGKTLSRIESQDNGVRKFVATVAEIPSDKELDLRRSASNMGSLGYWPEGVQDLTAADQVLNVEEDYRIKWIESSPVSFQNTPFGGSLE